MAGIFDDFIIVKANGENKPPEGITVLNEQAARFLASKQASDLVKSLANIDIVTSGNLHGTLNDKGKTTRIHTIAPFEAKALAFASPAGTENAEGKTFVYTDIESKQALEKVLANTYSGQAGGSLEIKFNYGAHIGGGTGIKEETYATIAATPENVNKLIEITNHATEVGESTRKFLMEVSGAKEISPADEAKVELQVRNDMKLGLALNGFSNR